jgi:hypothetical protein
MKLVEIILFYLFFLGITFYLGSLYKGKGFDIKPYRLDIRHLRPSFLISCSQATLQSKKLFPIRWKGTGVEGVALQVWNFHKPSGFPLLGFMEVMEFKSSLLI